jgi:hypothetical protein
VRPPRRSERIGQPDLDHVTLDRLAQPHARVVSLGDDIDEALLDDDLGEPKATDRLAWLGRDFGEGAHDLREGRPCAIDETSARVGQ